MTPADQKRLSRFLGITTDELIARHAYGQNGDYYVKVNGEGKCVFFGEACEVHPAKPSICRAWPFFKGNLEDETSWRMAQDYCPGINPDVPHEEFVRQGISYLRENGLLKEVLGEASSAML